MRSITDEAGRIRPDILDDPYSLYDELREEDPVHYDESLGGWALTRFADITAAAADARLSSERTQAYLNELPKVDRERFRRFAATRGDMLLFCDGEKHDRIRRSVTEALRAIHPRSLEERMQAQAQLLLAELGSGRRVELMSAYALAYPIAVLLDLLGIPETDAARVRRWATDFNLAIGGVIRPDLVAAAQLAIEEISDYLDALLKPAAAASPILAQLRAEQDAGRISAAELRASCLMLITAGHETVSNAIANSLLALLRHPDQMARLRSSPEKVPRAFDELLRFDAPVQLTAREAKAKLQIDGRRVEPGERVILLWGAANRDPAAFPEPSRLDLGRAEANRHLGFGVGSHRCAGASIARRELAIGLRALLERFPEMTLAAPPERNENFSFRGLRQLHVDAATA